MRAQAVMRPDRRRGAGLAVALAGLLLVVMGNLKACPCPRDPTATQRCWSRKCRDFGAGAVLREEPAFDALKDESGIFADGGAVAGLHVLKDESKDEAPALTGYDLTGRAERHHNGDAADRHKGAG